MQVMCRSCFPGPHVSLHEDHLLVFHRAGQEAVLQASPTNVGLASIEHNVSSTISAPSLKHTYVFIRSPKIYTVKNNFLD